MNHYAAAKGPLIDDVTRRAEAWDAAGRPAATPASDPNVARMRKQYNFWPGENGLDAWDVDRLIELSRGLPVKDVQLSAIWEIDTPYWSQPLTVRQIAQHVRLVRDVDPSYPIILAADGRVMDGMHRVVRALLEGQETIRAVQFETQPEPDYRNCRPEDLPYPPDRLD